MTNKPVILFDGVCNLCQSSVQFIIKRDKNAAFKFAALQSDAALQLLANQPPVNSDSVLLLQKDVLYQKSTAALKIAAQLNWPWPMLYVFIIVPTPIRDWAYDYIARNRYRWFGKQESCMVPTPNLKDRFL